MGPLIKLGYAFGAKKKKKREKASDRDIRRGPESAPTHILLLLLLLKSL